jgi:hypothetical protein
MTNAEPRRDRVAELIVTHPCGRRRGSGYLVGPGIVLTAAHVVAEAVEVEVRFEADLPGERKVGAFQWVGVGEADLALVAIPPVEDFGDSPEFGQIAPIAAFVSVQAVGFPLWKLREGHDGRMYRDSHHALGMVAPLSNWRTHTLEITVGVPPGDPSPGVSPWEGMSGAAVWADGRIVGVMRAHHEGDGLSRLDATSLAYALGTLDRAGFAAVRPLLPSLLLELPEIAAPRDLRGDVGAGDGERLRGYLDAVVENFQWLKLPGIDDAPLRVELDKVYVALKTEPEDDLVLGHLAKLHAIEVSEAAGGPMSAILPARLDELDAEVVRRTYRPRREQAERDEITEVSTIADAFRQHRRMVILGKPGSGKSTLGRWLALQLAKGVLDQLRREVPAGRVPPGAVRLHVIAGTRVSFSLAQFGVSDRSDTAGAVVVDALPGRGVLALHGAPVTAGQVITFEHVDRLTFTPDGDECGAGYTVLAFRVVGGTGAAPGVGTTFVVDVVPHLRVPVSQIDPDWTASGDLNRLIDLGPVRVPIYLRLADYAQNSAERARDHQPQLSLLKYMGRDPGLSGDDPDGRNELLVSLVEQRRAVIILDGLDELPEGNRRIVSEAVLGFIAEVCAFNGDIDADEPSVAGGNQVIVTSRYVGYKAMGLQAGCAHFGIQPMGRPAVEHFVRMWTAAVTAGAAPSRADTLIGEIYDDTRPSIRELADNPLHITILASVYWAYGRLPDQRAGIYDLVVENLLRIWLERPECKAHGLTRAELLGALEPLAAELQNNATSGGLVSFNGIGALIRRPLARMRGVDPDSLEFDTVLADLLKTISEHVGLLSEQASGNFAFSHRTFQEFLAARHILDTKSEAARTIIERLDDPNWREPLLLALGLAMISARWDSEARTTLVLDVLAGDDDDSMVPRAAMLLVQAIPDLADAPDDAIGHLVGQLLKSYSHSQDQPQAEGLREAIGTAFSRLRAGPCSDTVTEAVAVAIRRPQAGRDLSDAAAAVMTRIGWFTTETVDALLAKAHREHASPSPAVRWALVAALAQPVGGSREKQPPDLSTPRLLARYLPMRRLLEGNPTLTAFVRADVDWLWLMVALYGGVGCGDVIERLRAFQLRRLRKVRLIENTGRDDVAGPSPAVPPVEFSPSDITNDLADGELSRTIQRHLRARKPARQLVEVFRRAWEGGTGNASRADALVGLAALGEDVVPLVRAALTEPASRPAARDAVVRFQWLGELMREPLVRSAEVAARTIPDDVPEDHQLDLLRIVIEARAAVGGGPLRVADSVPAHRYVDATSEAVRDAVEAEHWAYVFSGFADDGLELEVLANSDPARLARAWSAIPAARNLDVRQRLPWSRQVLEPRRSTSVDHYLAMLDGVLTAPDELDRLAGVVLGSCTPLLADHPDLVWETLAVCCLRGPVFRTGFLAGAAGTGAARPAATYDAALSRLADYVGDDGSAGLAPVLSGMFPPRNEEASTYLDAGPSPDAVTSATVRAAGIKDPYPRFRALWRLVNATGHGDPRMAELTVVEALSRITDPHEAVRAFEAITLTMNEGRRGTTETRHTDHTVRKASTIADPVDHTRALVRLALLMPDLSGDLLASAVGAVGGIADLRERAEVIGGIRAAWGEFSEPVDALAEAVEKIDDPWLRDKVSGRASRLVAVYRDRYGAGALAWRLVPGSQARGATSHRLSRPTGHLPWGVLYLSAIADEVRRAADDRALGSTHWDQLLGPQRQAAVDQLVDSAAGDPLPVTTREAAVLGRVVESGETDVLAPLWAYLDSSDSAALAAVARWPGGDAAVDRWKALVQAEAGHLTPEIVGRLVELITDSADRLRLRAELALHGPTPHSRNRNRRWSVQRVGAPAVEAVAEQVLRDDLPPPVRTSLGWVRGDIHHDDLDALDVWLAQAEDGDGQPARRVLGMVESIDPKLVPRLVSALPEASPPVQRILLHTLARLAYATRSLLGAEDSVRAAIAQVPLEVRQAAGVLHEGAVTYLKAAEQAVAQYDEEARLDAAREMVAASRVWLDEASVSKQSACMKRLGEIGSGQYIGLGKNSGYWAEASSVAVSLNRDEDVLRLLLLWVEVTSLGGDDSDGPEDSGELDDQGHLLTAANAVAQLLPGAFAAAADPDEWELILTDWAETAAHWNKRLAAVRLLGLLRRVSVRSAEALRAAMNDVSFVQGAAYASATGFRYVKGEIVPRLLDLLEDPSAGVAASAVRLLTGLAQSEGVTADRRRILLGLREAIAKSVRARPVYLMRDLDEDTQMSIEFVDQLDRILYRAVLEIHGL